jgi:hypothetical protein
MVLQHAEAVSILRCAMVIGESFFRLGIFSMVLPFPYLICFS